MKSHVTRHKSIVIPYIRTHVSGAIKYIMFKDTNSGDYTFACGGKKLRETNVECGNRELHEESNCILYKVLHENQRPDRVFFGTNRSREERMKDHRENIIVTMKYCVYFVQVQDKDYNYLFHKSEKKNSETNDCIVVSKDEIRNINIWEFMGKEIIPYLI